MSDLQSQFTSSELKEWRQSLEEADRHNIFVTVERVTMSGLPLNRKLAFGAARAQG